MLNLAALADAAAPTRMPFSMGASFAGGCTVASRVRATETAVAFAAAEPVFPDRRPWPGAGALLIGNATHEALQVKSASQQPTSQKYTHTTRIAAAGGGALGPHPARDPV